MKKRNTLTKHDLRRAIDNIYYQTQVLTMRMEDIERVLSDYIEFEKNEDKFKKFVDGKYKQEERKRSGKSTTPSEE
mgnify:CR=1 FL=1